MKHLGWILDNLLYKVVALLIACVLWAAAQGVTDAEQSFDIPIELDNVPANVVVVDESAHEINLRVVGSRAALRQVAKNLTHYPVSLEGAKAGEARLAVTREQIPMPRGARIAARSPSTLVYTLETVTTKSVPVRPELVGQLPNGLRLGRVTVEPGQVVLAGARSALRNVREVLTDRIDLADLSETTTLESPVVLGYPHVWRKDADGPPIRIRVEVEPAPQASGG